MPKQLKDIRVSYISLVKAGANGKEVIYKSTQEPPVWTRDFKILKNDEEKGIVYGIVYSPDEEDSQGDFAKAEDIEKAAYDFMKSKKVENIDKEHTFKKEDAFVCESWIVRKGDALFPDEKEGSWAVGIKLENDELKKAVKSGEISGLSMAGNAKKTELKKANSTMEELVDTVKDIFSSVSFNLSGHHYRDLEKPKEGGKLNEELRKTLEDVLLKGLEPLNKKIEELEESMKKQDDALKKTKEEIEKHEELFSKSKQFFAFEKKKKESNDSLLA